MKMRSIKKTVFYFIALLAHTLIQENIESITSSKNNKITVIQTVALPQSTTNRNSISLKKMPEVSNLFKEIIETLDSNGEELLADNILYKSNKLGIKSKRLITEQRNLSANKIINKYMWITGGVILVNPLPTIDFLTTTSVNVQMIIELSKIYEVKITIKEAKELSKSLLSAIAKLGILKGGLAIISSALASNFTTLYLSKSIQSITAGWLIKIVGFSLIEYFKNGQRWGDGGIHEVINSLYKINKKDETLKSFVKEAISKIEINDHYQNQKKLPPFLK